jgi:hypothetical protein
MVAPEDEPAPEALGLYEQLKAQEDAEDRERAEAAAALERAQRSAEEAEALREEVREMARYDVGDDWADA